MNNLWDQWTKVSEHGIEVPPWIGDEINCNDVAAILQGGCASGAWMPAVTYYDARETMAEYGDDVLQFLEDSYGELPKPADSESWSGMAVFYLSCGVEAWASHVESELKERVMSV